MNVTQLIIPNTFKNPMNNNELNEWYTNSSYIYTMNDSSPCLEMSSSCIYPMNDSSTYL